ncbi:hypothetical protein GF318_04750 [Candidatus Micrarchaeota archaeon]|nr:hypothetical protein [Candidatus Micrarchaeota archaeon]
MARRPGKRLAHKKKEKAKKGIYDEKKQEEKRKGALPTKKVAIIVGRAYTLEEIQELIAALSSEALDVQFEAVSEFAENQGRISEGAAKEPEVSGTEIVDLVVAAVLKSEKEMLERFEKERRAKALSFLAKSGSVPEHIQKKAAEALQRILPEEAEAPKEEKEPEISLEKAPYGIEEAKALARNMESKARRLRIAAAVKFIKDYPRITPTVAKAPMMTVTSVTEKAIVIIKENTDKVLDMMAKKRMLPALLFLASLAQVPMQIRKKAEKTAERLKAELPEPRLHKVEAPEAEVEAPQPEPMEVREEEPAMETPAPQAMTIWDVKAMMRGLDVRSARAVLAAMKFLQNYDQVTKEISKAPMLTVTEVTKKVADIVETNRTKILKKLKEAKDVNTINFLANSSKFSKETRKQATLLLKRMVEKTDEKKEAFKKMLPPFEEDEDDNQ